MDVDRHTDHRSHSISFHSGRLRSRSFRAIHIQWKSHHNRLSFFFQQDLQDLSLVDSL
jgi:hypothetical protein